MGYQYKFGDKVVDDVYGEGIVVVSKKSFYRVYFKGSGNVRFDMSEIDDLKPASDWIEIDWDNESTLPPTGKNVLILLAGGFICIDSYKCPFAFYDHGFSENYHYPTHWQPLPQPPK